MTSNVLFSHLIGQVASLLAAGEDESARFTAQGILFLEKKIMIYRLLMLAGQHLGQHYGAIERAQNQCPRKSFNRAH